MIYAVDLMARTARVNCRRAIGTTCDKIRNNTVTTYETTGKNIAMGPVTTGPSHRRRPVSAGLGLVEQGLHPGRTDHIRP